MFFAVLFCANKDFNSKYERLIQSDVAGYYAYLPATFIYHDFSFNFTNAISDEYYVDGRATKKEFINYYKHQPVNKYWVGLSILWFPFFLIAHFLSLLLQLPNDGYNNIYQFCIGISAAVYLYLGIFYFKKILENYSTSKSVIFITILAFLLGTNLYYYSVFSPCLSHSFTFVFLLLFVSQLLKFKAQSEFKLGTFLILITSACLVVFIRPLNAFLLLFSVLFVFTFTDIKLFFKQLINSKKALAFTIVLPLLLLFLQLYIWKIQTGFWFVDSYAGESFNLNNSNFINFTISYAKGWLLYTPICVFSIAGIFIHYKKQKLNLALAFLILVCWIYLLSSWWIWTYGTSFGQRLMIDTYPILAIFFCTFLNAVTQKMFKILAALIVLLIGLNLFQSWQLKNGILPEYFVTKNIYWRSFLTTQRHAYKLYNP